MRYVLVLVALLTREDTLLLPIDRFLATNIFGPNRLTHFRAQHATLAHKLHHDHADERGRIDLQVAELDGRIARQLAAIEVGVDPVLVAQRIEALKTERAEHELAPLDRAKQIHAALNLAEAGALLESTPDLRTQLHASDPEVRRQLYDAFRLSVELDRNQAK